MINVTEEFKKNIKTTYAKVVCTYSDGNTDTFNKDIMQGENNIIDESTSATFPIGDSICKYVTISLDNSNQKYSDKDFFNATLDYYLYQNKESGTTETIKKGTYTVSEAKYYDDLIEITALDDMWKADKEYKTNLPLPQPLLALIVDACDTCEILMGFSSLENNFVIESLPEGISFRDFFGYAAMAQCANARIDVSNKLQFKNWDFESIPHVLTNYIQSPALSSDNVVITGIKISNDNNTYSYGQSGYELSLSNRLLNDAQCQEIAEYIYNCIGDRPFRTLNGQLMTDASVEFGDMATSVDRHNNEYLTPITSVYYALQGITDVKTVTEEPIRNASIYSSLAEEAIVEAKKLVAKEKTEREQAIEDLAGKIVSSTSGLYMTVQQQETGGSIYYMHNKETLEESDIIWKLTAEAFAISTDGGLTYPYGFVVDGELITRLLYAEGINASYIDTGSFTVKDNKGNVKFQADVNTGKLIIDTENIKLDANGILKIYSAYVNNSIKLSTPKNPTLFTDAIYANNGDFYEKAYDWVTENVDVELKTGTMLVNIGSNNVPLKINASTRLDKNVTIGGKLYVDNDMYANGIGCIGLKATTHLKLKNKNVITEGTFANYIKTSLNVNNYRVSTTATKILFEVKLSGYTPISYNLYYNYSHEIIANFEDVRYENGRFYGAGYARTISNINPQAAFALRVVWLKNNI